MGLDWKIQDFLIGNENHQKELLSTIDVDIVLSLLKRPKLQLFWF